MDLNVNKAILTDLVEKQFLAEIKNDELMEKIARGWISPKEATFRIQALLMMANDSATKEYEKLSIGQSELVIDEHECFPGIG